MTDSINREKLKSFLFLELGDEERQTLEERFFEDNELFDDLMELENELVDQYISNDLSDKDRLRFEKSLANLPERREKIANAGALQTFIAEETQAAAGATHREIIGETPTLWEKIAAFFTFQMPVMQYATALLVLVLVGGMTYLVYDNIKTKNEMAEIKKQQEEQERIKQREEELKRLEEQRQQNEQRQKELQNQTPDTDINSEIPNNQSDKTEELNKLKEEQQKIVEKQKRLEDEKFKNDKTLPPVQKKDLPQPPKPVIASITLLPLSGSKGGGDEIKDVDKNASAISATLKIPEDIKSESFTVTLNGAPLPGVYKPNANSITVRISTKNLKPGNQNRISIIGNDGKRKDYGFRLKI